MTNRDIEFVRVRIKDSGVEKSIPASKWETSRDLFAKLQSAAVDSNGDPLPDLQPTKGAKNKTGQSAEPLKEK